VCTLATKRAVKEMEFTIVIMACWSDMHGAKPALVSKNGVVEQLEIMDP
jgi:hypothetical protein